MADNQQNERPMKSLTQTSSERTDSGSRRVSDLLDNDRRSQVNRLSASAVKPKVELPKLPPDEDQAMSKVFIRMRSIYGHLWSSNYKTEEGLQVAKAEWMAAFKRHSFTDQDVRAALDYCVGRVPDMPNLPQFIEIVKIARLTRRRARERTVSGPALPETPEQAAAREAAKAAKRAATRERDLAGVDMLKAVLAGK